MSRSHLNDRQRRRHASLLAGILGLCLAQVGSHAAAASDLAPTMKFAPSATFASAQDQRFELVAGEIELGDDCNPLPSASSTPTYTPPAAASSRTDAIMMAKADGEKKGSRSRNREVKEDPPTMVDAAPMATGPAALGLAADGSRDWEIIVSDRTLNATMARWAASAGWQLLWELPVDYAVQARTRVHGTFEEAVSTVARSMESAEIPMKAVFYQGNKVLRIMAKGSE